MTSTETAAHEVANGLDNAADKAGDAIEQTEARVRSKLSETAGALEARYRELTVEAERIVATARSEASKRYGELQDRVREQPEIGIGLGVLAGMALAMILSGGHKTIIIGERRH